MDTPFVVCMSPGLGWVKLGMIEYRLRFTFSFNFSSYGHFVFSSFVPTFLFGSFYFSFRFFYFYFRSFYFLCRSFYFSFRSFYFLFRSFYFLFRSFYFSFRFFYFYFQSFYFPFRSLIFTSCFAQPWFLVFVPTLKRVPIPAPCTGSPLRVLWGIHLVHGISVPCSPLLDGCYLFFRANLP